MPSVGSDLLLPLSEGFKLGFQMENVFSNELLMILLNVSQSVASLR